MKLNKRDDLQKDGFLFEMQRIAMEVDSLIQEYGLQKEAINIMVLGLFDNTEEDEQRLRAIYSYKVENVHEMDTLIEFIYSTWLDEDENNETPMEDLDPPDVEAFLKSLGISLN